MRGEGIRWFPFDLDRLLCRYRYVRDRSIGSKIPIERADRLHGSHDGRRRGTGSLQVIGVGSEIAFPIIEKYGKRQVFQKDIFGNGLFVCHINEVLLDGGRVDALCRHGIRTMFPKKVSNIGRQYFQVGISCAPLALCLLNKVDF